MVGASAGVRKGMSDLPPGGKNFFLFLLYSLRVNSYAELAEPR
jgi:hypothetical protein